MSDDPENSMPLSEVKDNLKAICEALITRNSYQGASRDFFIQYTRFVRDEENLYKWTMRAFEFSEDALCNTHGIEYSEKETGVTIRLYQNDDYLRVRNHLGDFRGDSTDDVIYAVDLYEEPKISHYTGTCYTQDGYYNPVTFDLLTLIL